ncbi:baseplate J/gp47 family protein [Salmonella enterica]|uniref:Baseplate protein J-like barrel domain-containing protein n=1 Tax=Salmonella newport TaxID=108619 RepID=A0A5X8XZ56_SALNE|nr:hypothetical protein [Salmonella enterica subsp. enterica serovar Rubislaw]EAB3729412.1 hypothetical protein [Salmonella enterica]EBV0462423.1 hypothetical protein [Salmonella enterica subsp. enterica serovar Newport]ECI3331222.1 hypothetical protein [Salmonella enterica subsp. diarizonae]EDW1732253.1 hypothetical protein [Salmonella enterica subsp. enterica]
MYEEVIAGMLPVINESGISAPDFQTVLNGWQTVFRGIYGDDIYIAPDSKDGMLLSLIAYAMHGCNNTAVAVYNSFSPETATGRGLARNVKINGITRKIPGNSTVDVVCTGRVGTVIHNGAVRDAAGNLWSLPALVTLDTHGNAVVTAVCQKEGAVSALPGDIREIATPTAGWQSATNTSAAAVGKPAETDTELRLRQSQSVALPSRTVMEGMLGALTSLDGVVRVKGFDNDSGDTDANGIPAGHIAVIAEGGDSEEIARTIALKKTPGVPTSGTTQETVTDSYGNQKVINFYRPVKVPVYIELHIKVMTGYNTDIGRGISRAVSDYINSLDIGTSVYLSRIYTPATLQNQSSGNTYELLSVTVGKSSTKLSTNNIVIAFNEAAVCQPENVIIITEAP